MRPRLVDPEVEKDFRERSKGACEEPSDDALPKVTRVLLHSKPSTPS